MLQHILVDKKSYLFIFTIASLLSGAGEIPTDSGDVVTKVKSVSIGPSQYEVTCFESPTYCAEEFRKLCPNGFSVGGYFINEFDHGQITAIINCEDNIDN